MERIDKKLREAAFFLRKVAEHDRRNNPEDEFCFYLSAFLNAARSVDYRLRHEEGAAYRDFRISWDQALSPSDDQLMKYLVDDRNCEVHESGSKHKDKAFVIQIKAGTYGEKSGTVEVCAPPGEELVDIFVSTYLFTINDKDIAVVKACKRYFDLLERLVTEYRATKE